MNKQIIKNRAKINKVAFSYPLNYIFFKFKRRLMRIFFTFFQIELGRKLQDDLVRQEGKVRVFKHIPLFE
jgi:hypothetical protein